MDSDSENEVTSQEVIHQENERGFTSDFMIHQDQLNKIKKVELGLKKESVFRIPNKLTQFINNVSQRKNEIFYCISTKEMSIDIKNVKGQIYLPLLTKEEINSRLNTIPIEVRKKISMVHLGAVKILIKAQFRDGINTPLKMALIDNRINDRKDCILGAAQGNLAYGRFMFTVYPKFGISLQTQNLDQVLSFVHDFERHKLMNEGDKVFSITYLVGYALTNSHHSIDYKNNSNIQLEDVFQEIGRIEESQFCDLTPLDNSWAIDIAKNKKYLGQPLPNQRISRNILEIQNGNSTPRTSISQTGYTPDRRLLASMSKRIEDFGEKLDHLIG